MLFKIVDDPKNLILYKQFFVSQEEFERFHCFVRDDPITIAFQKSWKLNGKVNWGNHIYLLDCGDIIIISNYGTSE